MKDKPIIGRHTREFQDPLAKRCPRCDGVRVYPPKTGEGPWSCQGCGWHGPSSALLKKDKP